MIVHPTIESTEDGSPTLRHPLIGESYHSLRGAVNEAMHVYIRHGLEGCLKRKIAILEVGFGSGLNAWLSLESARKRGIDITYHAIDLYPVDLSVAKRLSYTQDPLFLQLHRTPWGREYCITPGFRLKKTESDLVGMKFDTIFDIVYFDAFAPDKQPELWSEGVFREIGRCMLPGGILVTYSAKGDVKRALRAAGFEVTRLQGALGKRHMLKAVKK